MPNSIEGDYLTKLFELNIKEKLGDIAQEKKSSSCKSIKNIGIKEPRAIMRH
jgi:hypothetical protein